MSELEVSLIPRNHMVVICTGSQGETRAAMAKIAASVHETIELQSGDTVIYSSRQIPGNEPAITKVQDMLVRRGIHLITMKTGLFMCLAIQPVTSLLRCMG